MSFWSSQRLESNLRRLIGHSDASVVDCNAITLKIGHEAYITPGLEDPAPNSQTKRLLGPAEPIAIPSGRFAFLLTEETVTIPAEVMGFISMKATYKAKGLVNVSGFHVDPGWSAPLVFAVYNAGPATVHLQRGMPLFLLWIADLEAPSRKHKTTPGPTGIPPAMINNITGVVDSIYALERRLSASIDQIKTQMGEIRERQTRVIVTLSVAAVVGGAIVGAVVNAATAYLFPAQHPAEHSSGPVADDGKPARTTSTPAHPNSARAPPTNATH